MGTHHSGRVPGHECPIDEMPPDSWKARRAHEALLKAQCAVLGAGAGAFPDRAEMLGQLARAAGRAGFGFAVGPETGRASWWDRVCQDGLIPGGCATFKKKHRKKNTM